MTTLGSLTSTPVSFAAQNLGTMDLNSIYNPDPSALASFISA